MYAVAHPVPRRPTLGQLCRVSGGVAGVLIQGVPGWGADLTLPGYYTPPLCTSRQPRPSSSPSSTATAATARGG